MKSIRSLAASLLLLTGTLHLVSVAFGQVRTDIHHHPRLWGGLSGDRVFPFPTRQEASLVWSRCTVDRAVAGRSWHVYEANLAGRYFYRHRHGRGCLLFRCSFSAKRNRS